MYRIKTPYLEVTATKGCEWLKGPALTVRMTGYMRGLGTITKNHEAHTLEIAVETFWDKNTGEMHTVTWKFTGSSSLSVMSMLQNMVRRVREADEQDVLEPV